MRTISSLKETGLSLHSVCLTVAWAYLYARERLDENHPLWPQFFAYSEWFRHITCHELDLPLDKPWAELQRLTGCLIPEAYGSKEAQLQAVAFGRKHFLDDRNTSRMFQELEVIKYQITGRL